MAVTGFGRRLKNLFTTEKISDHFFEDLEDMLIESDLGAKTSLELVEKLRKEIKRNTIVNEKEFIKTVRDYLSEYLIVDDFKPDENKLNIIMILGVNGVGKTTTIAKLASYYKKEFNMTSVLSAGDTFRAAAIDQLIYHGDKLNMRVVHQQQGSDPGSVIFDSIDSAFSRGEKIIIADTAGRMHNRDNLVKELKKINKIISNKVSDGIYKKFLVIDATTGQNGIRQAESFNEAVGLDGIIMAKYDSASKGGIIIPICRDLKIPVLFLGTGEGYDDFIKFDRENFLNYLLGIE